MADTISVVPANKASWEDLQAIFGTGGDPARCQCQSFKLERPQWRATSVQERADRLREQTRCGQPRAGSTSGLVAYLDGEPVGWCAVEPRSAYSGLLRVYRTPWEGRNEDKADDTVWAVTCVFVRAGYRKRGIAHALAAAAVDYARERGARALEAYPMRTEIGEVTWDEIHVGAESIFATAGMSEVSRPGIRRVVMRVDF
jgi:GNAT superfamily N-acetyltransferase